MENQWQDKTRGGDPVEVTGRICNGVYVLEGRVTQSDGGSIVTSWTKDGQNLYGQVSKLDLIPLEAPVEAPADPAKVHAHNRMVLALAATQYKRARDATEAAEEAQMLARNALSVALKAHGVQAVVVNIDGAAFLLEDQEQFLSYAEIEVL